MSSPAFLSPRDGTPQWQLLQVSDVLDLEFASALAEQVPVLAWKPDRQWRSMLTPAGREPEHFHPGSALRVRSLPRPRGSTRVPFSLVARLGPSVLKRLLAQTPDPVHSPLICTTPFFPEVAERWPGPVVYWLTDLIAEYASADRAHVEALDRRLCAAATLVCPNSRRLAAYLRDHAACDPAKIEIVPNATRAVNVFAQVPPPHAAEHPALAAIPRPFVGIIGNLAGNMDWPLLRDLLTRLPAFSFVFVGPTTMVIPDAAQSTARQAVLGMPNAHFVGRQAYGDLAAFARAFDVALLPYYRCEPTYSGSSTRFYEHLAACRPMVATRGFAELSEKEPLLRLVDTADQASVALEQLASQGFDDGLTGARWQASLEGTWSFRATTVRRALAERRENNSLTPSVGNSAGARS